MIAGFAVDNDNEEGIDTLTSFEILSPFEKFKSNVESNSVFERQAAGRTLCEAVESCDTKDEFHCTMLYVARLSQDPEPTVRVELMERVPELSHKCIEKAEQLKLPSSMVEEEILPLVMDYLKDFTNTARKAAQQSLVEILPLFEKSVCENKILPCMLGLANAHTDDYRTEAVTLLAKIVPRLGKEVTTDVVLPVYLASCHDDLFHVRKVCAHHAPDFARVVGLDTTESQILPVFGTLADDVVWGVRKACAESFSHLSSVVSESSRNDKMSDMFVKLLNDESRWVRLAAYQELGKFIASFTAAVDDTEETKMVKDDEKADSPDSGVESVIAEKTEVPEFATSSYWKVSLPTVDFSELSLDDEDDDVEVDEPLIVAPLVSALPLATPTPEAGDSSATSEDQDASTPDRDIYESLGLNIKDGNQIFIDDDHEEPVDYSSKDGQTTADQEDEPEDEDDDEEEYPGQDAVHISTSSFNSDHSEQNKSTEEAEVLPQNVIPEVLLKYYLSMPMSKSQAEFHNAELASHCAYSLPGVALTLGRQNWKCLKDIYIMLAQNVQWKVRRTLAASIHEIANILGEQMASEELVDIFNDFLNDLDEVRIGLLKNIAQFLSMVNAEARINYLNKMVEFMNTDNQRNWRFRLTLAFQMNKVISLYTPQQVADNHTQIVLELLQDKIAAVRLQASHLAASITEHLMDNEEETEGSLAESFVDNMISFSRTNPYRNQQFARGKKWINRCVFCYYCNALLDPSSLQHPADDELELLQCVAGVEDEPVKPRRSAPYISDHYFEQKLMPHLMDLTQDTITNVKICAVRTLKNVMSSRQHFQNKQSTTYQKLETIMRQLAKDTDRDVQQLAEEWLIDEEDDESFIALCPDEIERNLPDGSLSFSSAEGDHHHFSSSTHHAKRTSSPANPDEAEPVELEDIEGDEQQEQQRPGNESD